MTRLLPLALLLTTAPAVPANAEYQLYWGCSLGWASVEGTLDEGPARVELVIDKPGEGWRQVDAICITDDPTFAPVGREKPPFAYLASFALQPRDGAAWRGTAAGLKVGSSWRRRPLGGRDFSMWTGLDADPKWWGRQEIDKLTLADVYFQQSPPAD